jgi:hypothetical protein
MVKLCATKQEAVVSHTSGGVTVRNPNTINLMVSNGNYASTEQVGLGSNIPGFHS